MIEFNCNCDAMHCCIRMHKTHLYRKNIPIISTRHYDKCIEHRIESYTKRNNNNKNEVILKVLTENCHKKASIILKPIHTIKQNNLCNSLHESNV